MSTQAKEGQAIPFRDRSDLLDFLLEVSSLVSSTLDLDRMLAELAGVVQGVIRCELLAFLLYSERKKGLRVRYSIGYGPSVKGLVIPLDEGITGVAASARMVINCGDVLSDPRYIASVSAVRSELAVPMTARGRLVGVIDLQSTRPNAFSESDSAMLQLIASRVASSVLNAQLFRRLEQQNRTLRTLATISREISSILKLDELLGKIASTVRGLINYDAFSLLLVDEERQVLRHRFSLRYDQRVQLDNIPLGQGITGSAAATRELVRVEDTRTDPRYLERNPGILSEIAVPLLLSDRLIGVLNLESERVGFFVEDHARTLTLLAPLVAGAVENARLYEEVARGKLRMERDLAAAHHVQSQLLPKEDPGIKGLEIATRFRPAHEVSGDLFDFFEHGDDDAVITIGDVSGKSAAAALYSAMVTGLLRIFSRRRRSPSALLAAVNDALLERQSENQYLTLLVALWTPAERTLTLSSAAGIPPLVCRRGDVFALHLEGFPLGLLAGRVYEETTFKAEPDDLILLYSDGIQDQQDQNGVEYGRGALQALLPGLAGRTAREIVDGILDDFDRFRGGRRLADDQTLIAIKVK